MDANGQILFLICFSVSYLKKLLYLASQAQNIVPHAATSRTIPTIVFSNKSATWFEYAFLIIGVLLSVLMLPALQNQPFL